jgi:L-cysteine S-thiosulfotransferase
MQPPITLAASEAGDRTVAILRNVTFLTVACWIAIAAGPLEPGSANAATCKRKTAGFYLTDMNVGGPRSLPAALQGQGLPGPLTPAPGDAERGREVLVNRQKGDCLSCHKVSTLAGAAGQGAIGPVLDGVGAKYSDAQVRQVLIEPKALFPDTIMPSYYAAAGGSVLTAAEVEDLIAFLRTLK